MEKKAVILLSGGVDSATCLAIAKAEGYELHALSFNYGQRHAVELKSASRIAETFGAAHLIIALDLARIGGSALTDKGIRVPKGKLSQQNGSGIPPTYVPARNTLFLAYALAWAEVLRARDIFVGVNAIDYSGYPDCRPEFVEAFENLANLGTKAGVEGMLRFKIHAPLIRLTKAEIIRKGQELGVDFSLTHSCYDPLADGRPCGACESCLLRRKGFAEAGVIDPGRYPRQRREGAGL